MCEIKKKDLKQSCQRVGVREIYQIWEGDFLFRKSWGTLLRLMQEFEHNLNFRGSSTQQNGVNFMLFSTSRRHIFSSD
jgi:hypothetical protein